MREKINIVWLKRDLRTTDHDALHKAEQLKQKYIIIYIFEDSQLNHPDFSERHQQFIYKSILEMNKILSIYQRKVNIFHGEAKEIFEYLGTKYQLNQVFSFQESGTLNSWKRDKQVSQFFRNKKIEWTEFENQAVIRGSKNRNGWDKHWFVYANSKIINNTFSQNNFHLNKTPFDFDIEKFQHLKKYPNQYQPPGEKYAKKYLNSFIQNRAKNYNRYISQPEKSRYSCGRISTYLSWGNISLRTVFQYIKKAPNYNDHKRAYNSFLSRLKWRSHFIQKFEVDCSYEQICINKGYEQMQYKNDDNLLEKWKNGLTGFPMVDASMRCLKHNGWLNFRMRAMLVSFLCHYLEQDWRRGVYHLAQLFLDYEPGIHFTQFQMQAGVTGINSIRVYNPIKQSIEKDKNGVFLKKWIPELSSINNDLIHQPWLLTDIDLIDNPISETYRNPVISTSLASSDVKKQLWELRKNDRVKSESRRLLNIHVRAR